VPLLGGRYRVERVLGRGGMGLVLAVTCTETGACLALKRVLPEVAKEGEAVARFLREARATSRIESEHVPKLFDVGTLDDGSPYMVMERLEGCDLGAVLGERGALGVTESLDLVVQALVALDEAHAAGFVLRSARQGARLRHHQTDVRCARSHPDADPWWVARLAALHVPRAGARREAPRRPERSLVGRGHPLRARLGGASVRRRLARQPALRDPRRLAGAARRARGRVACGVRQRRHAVPRQGSVRATGERRRARAGARASRHGRGEGGRAVDREALRTSRPRAPRERHAPGRDDV